ncbi:LYR motif-containing protein 4 [Acanthopagrus latus]|uniref:LYR motif-containing protein 4 n=1 Tax=Acanthopagrus latus TaxID=8177 RepID=UPI00187BFB41|nr:LYR motif-containing protein 4 [Acanthopagrus latus]
MDAGLSCEALFGHPSSRGPRAQSVRAELIVASWAASTLAQVISLYKNDADIEQEVPLVQLQLKVISIFRDLLRESNRYPSHFYWTYALRRVRDAFRANRTVDDPKTVARLMAEGQQTLALIQRQVAIGKMFETQKTVVEG